MAGPSVTIQRAALSDADAVRLIAALDAEISERYPEENANFFSLNEDEVAPGHGAFVLAYVDGVALGCGAVRALGDGDAEIKRMYVAPGNRGLGVGGRLLDALTVVARELGVRRLVLETGERQPEAVALYRRAGFEAIPCFGGYADAPLSLCMAKQLDGVG